MSAHRKSVIAATISVCIVIAAIAACFSSHVVAYWFLVVLAVISLTFICGCFILLMGFLFYCVFKDLIFSKG
jgi:hypothetical protein